MKLVPNAGKAWKWLSMQLMGLALLWESIPEEAKDAVFTDANQGRITVGIILAAAVGRMIDQGTAQ